VGETALIFSSIFPIIQSALFLQSLPGGRLWPGDFD